LNFDKASKGNPGPVGLGGIFRENTGHTRWVYTDKGGLMTNNEEEMMAIYQGFKIAIRNGYRNLEIEGDSQIIIEVLRKMDNGKDWEQVAKSWRMVGLIQDMANTLKCIDYKIISHVKREGNKATDFLANWGCQEGKVDSIWPTIMNKPEWETLNQIII